MEGAHFDYKFPLHFRDVFDERPEREIEKSSEASRRDRYSGGSFEMSDISASFLDMFPEDSRNPPESSYDSSEEKEEEDHDGEVSPTVKENRAFWKSQNELLQVIRVISLHN